MAFVLLNRDALTVNYKHSDTSVLCNLAWIELQEHYHAIGEPVDVLRGLTDMELKMLYRNITGKDITTDSRFASLQILIDLLEAMPVADVYPLELETQAACINEGQRGFFKYVKGAKRPAQIAELFNPSFTTESDPEAEARALAGDWPSLAKKTPVKTHQQAPQQAQAQKPARTTSAPQKEPGATTTSGKIWALADSVRKDFEGKNRGADIAGIKKAVVDTLLAEGINRSTITTQLSHWQKNRFPQ